MVCVPLKMLSFSEIDSQTEKQTMVTKEERGEEGINQGFRINRLKESESHSVVSNSLRRHGLYSPWNSPGQNTGVGSLSLLQGIFPTQGSNRGLPHCRRILASQKQDSQTEKQTMVTKEERGEERINQGLRINRYALLHRGLPGGASGKDSACQCRRCKRCRFNPWIRKTPCRREWLPTQIFLPGKSHGQRSLAGYIWFTEPQSWTWLNTLLYTK